MRQKRASSSLILVKRGHKTHRLRGEDARRSKLYIKQRLAEASRGLVEARILQQTSAAKTRPAKCHASRRQRER